MSIMQRRTFLLNMEVLKHISDFGAVLCKLAQSEAKVKEVEGQMHP